MVEILTEYTKSETLNERRNQMDFLRKLFGRKSSAATSSKESPLAKMAISWLRKGYEKEESGAVGEAHDCYEKLIQGMRRRIIFGRFSWERWGS
jgi:hypothetical protein